MSTEKKLYTLADLQASSTKDNLLVLINGKVYNAAKFLDEHPGGDEVILAEAGKDASEAFEDVGHSDEAREVLQGLYAGDFDPEELKKPASKGKTGDITPSSGSTNPITYIVPVSLVGAYLAWRFYFAP